MLVVLADWGYQLPIRLAAFSAMASTVAFRGALGITGMTEASATRSPASPCTRQCWSTTAKGSDAGPILQVPELCCVVVTWCSNQVSSASSEANA